MHLSPQERDKLLVHVAADVEEGAKSASAHTGITVRNRFINIGSVASRITPPNSAVYSGTKAAVDAITIVLSRELGPKKIRVNSLSPGVVETEPHSPAQH